MKTKKMLPIGIESFEDIRSRECYYVDKTGFIGELLENGSAVNLCGNDIIRSLLGKATQTTKQELERLVGGGSIERAINRELTYRELYSSIDNLWSVLYATGYLTVSERPRGDIFRLVIPNREIQKIYVKQIMEWIQEEASRDTPRLDRSLRRFRGGGRQGGRRGLWCIPGPNYQHL